MPIPQAQPATAEGPNFPPGTVYVKIMQIKRDGSGMELVGYIGWDGTKYAYDFPDPDQRVIQSIMSTRVRFLQGGRMIYVDATDPERWLSSLHLRMNNVSGKASKAKRV